MTEVLAPFGTTPTAVERVGEAPSRTPVLITEQEVLFATAAAVPLQPPRTGRRWIEAARVFVTAAFVKSSRESRPKRRHYPASRDFLEHSRMAREMTRL
jgi:hypothetical protein